MPMPPFLCNVEDTVCKTPSNHVDGIGSRCSLLTRTFGLTAHGLFQDTSSSKCRTCIHCGRLADHLGVSRFGLQSCHLTSKRQKCLYNQDSRSYGTLLSSCTQEMHSEAVRREAPHRRHIPSCPLLLPRRFIAPWQVRRPVPYLSTRKMSDFIH